MKIYILGNPLIAEDSLPIKLFPQLKKKFSGIDFQIVDPNENFPPKGEKNLNIIDTVIGIKKPIILDLNSIEETKQTPISPHDYDLMFHLQLLLKLKKIDSVKIIGIPLNQKRTDLIRSILPIIATLLLKSEPHMTYTGQKRG